MYLLDVCTYLCSTERMYAQCVWASARYEYVTFCHNIFMVNASWERGKKIDNFHNFFKHCSHATC